MRSRVSSTGADCAPERLKRAALVVSGASQTISADVLGAVGLIPQATPAARKPWGSRPSCDLGHAAPGTSTQREVKKLLIDDPRRPRAGRTSGSGSARPREAVPFQRLSIAPNTITRPVRSSRCSEIRQMLVSRTARTPAGSLDELDELLGRRRRRGRARSSSAVADGRVGQRHVTGDELALVERQQVRRERDRDVVAERRELLLDLRRVTVTRDAVGVDVLIDGDEVRLVGGAASGAGDAGLGVDDDVGDQPGARQRGQRQDRRGRIAAGVGDQLGAARSARGRAPAARRRPARSAPAPGAACTTPRRSRRRAAGSRR